MSINKDDLFLAIKKKTRLDEPEKTALAEFLRFFALKKVFSNHHKILYKNSKIRLNSKKYSYTVLCEKK